MKTQDDYHATKNRGKERLEDHSTSVAWLCKNAKNHSKERLEDYPPSIAWLCNRCRVVF